ncbi:MAG: CvpA family protein [Ekhidna sp.]|nr:CvpA family protein [Ekhidna sp.]
MNTFDIILIIILGLGAIKGYFKGFIVEFFSLLAFFIGLFLALELTIPVSLSLFGESRYFNVILMLVFTGLFILLSFLIKSGARMVKKAVSITPFGTLDNIIGAVTGIFKAALIVSVIIWICSSVGIDIENSYAANSTIFPYIVVVGSAVIEAFGYLMPMIDDLTDLMENIPKTKDTFISVLI